MIDLTNFEEIKKLDPKDVYRSTGMLADQIRQIWEDGKKIRYPSEYKNIRNIVICGMGGSSYGGRVTNALFKDSLPVPIYTSDDYHLPKYVNESSLVIATSYSGTTEESISCTHEALERKAKIAVLTSGGTLASFLKENSLPGIVFEPRFNPSGQPRLGPGYIVGGTISILASIGFLDVNDQIILSAIDELVQSQEAIKNITREFAQQVYGNIPVFFAAEFLKGNIYIMRNQTNETAKSFASFSELPDLNHHLMEGLKNPPDKRLITVFISSDLYSDVLKKRVQLTENVVTKNGVPFVEYKATGSSKIAQVFNVLSFGAYLAVHLGLLYGQDPSLIPWVDYFKAELAKT